jgi:hypothetical protein
MEGGDLVQVSPDRNRASAPMRAVYPAAATGSPLVGSPVSPDTTSWLMTVTPSESTPIIPLTKTQQNFDGTVRSNRPVEIPRIYNLAVVVFSKRDVRDINPTMDPALGTLPSSERVLRVSDIASDALTSGTFTITVEGSSSISPRIKIGDWLMMSRYTSQELLPRVAANPTIIARQVHRWYRVVGITGEETFPRVIRVSGKPWNWTDGEISDRRERGLPFPTLPPSPATIETHAVLLKDVVQVYERQVELQ